MRRPRRRSILALIGTAAATAAAVPIIAVSAPPAGTKAPDLRADPVDNISQPGVYASIGGLDTTNRLLVRFNGYVTNVGNGPLEIRGNPQIPGDVKQYAFSSTQSGTDLPSVAVGTPPVYFEGNDSHNHFHLKKAMEYSLWNMAKTAMVAPGQKVGFCLYDSLTAPAPSPPPADNLYNESVTHFCDAGDPGATFLRMGVGSGRRDIYNTALAFQWVDVSSTAPGQYLLASLADPDNTIWEQQSGNYGGGGETNTRTFASQPVTVPGYVAKPVTVTQAGGPQSIGLDSTTFGSPGGRVFKIVTPPAHGTLGVATGQAFTGPTVTYTPAAGYAGADSFTYVARDASSGFPTAGSEPVATVSLLAAGPSVAISGAPQTMTAGTSAQLSASLANLPGGVTWSTTAGSITGGGLLTAPAAPPAGGTITVRATSTANSGVFSEVVIAVGAAPTPQPAPLPGGVPVVTGKQTKLLSKLTVGHDGRRIVVGTITTGAEGGPGGRDRQPEGPRARALRRAGRRPQDRLLQDRAARALSAHQGPLHGDAEGQGHGEVGAARVRRDSCAAGLTFPDGGRRGDGHLVACRGRRRPTPAGTAWRPGPG